MENIILGMKGLGIMDIDNSIHLFQDTKVLSVISKAGYITLVMGPQILSEWKHIGAKEFTVHVNANKEVIESLFETKDEFIVSEDEDGIIVEELASSNYIFQFITIEEEHNLYGTEEFFKHVIQNTPLSAYHVGYQFPAGVLFEGDSWMKLKDGIYDVEKSYSTKIKNDATLFLNIFEDLVNYPLITLSKNAIKSIIQNNKEIDSLSLDDKYQLIQIALERKPSLLETFHNLNVLKWICPEIDACFLRKSRDLNSSYKSAGMALTSVVAGLPLEIAFAITSLIAGGAYFMPSYEESEYIQYSNCVQSAIEFAEKQPFSDSQLAQIKFLILLLAEPIPNTKEQMNEFILLGFETLADMAVYITGFSAYSAIFEDEINKKNIDKLGKMADYARSTRSSWDRNSINISDEALISLVGIENFRDALRYIREVLLNNPSLNDPESISDFVMGSNMFVIQEEQENISREQNEKENELRQEQSKLLNAILDFDQNRINRILSPIGPLNKQDIEYIDSFNETNRRLDAVNLLLIELGYATEEEEKTLKLCHKVNNPERYERKESEVLEFIETDTSFFEQIRMLSSSL